MTAFTIGLIFLIIGLFLLPFGIIYFKEEFKKYESTTSKKKLLIIFLEIFDMFFSQSMSTWLIFISIILITVGIFFIYVK
ncbi:hypothetical protein [Gottfriedia luciferensis]|uniref:hypothetical protein n=1 Tax=Gottfriedia luciferensis TaxID=178774 RepID=UPI000B447256|nr:hypothetical protein [Gottfriedia luciferensis]